MQKNKFLIEWDNYTPIKSKLKLQILNNVSINRILKFVDWKPFFEAWELYGNYPDILEDKVVGSAAKELWRDAQKMIKK